MSEKYPTKRAYATGKLYKFLKEEGVYKQFVKNCKTQKKGKDLIISGKGFKTAHGIGSAFLWRETPEGYDFWDRLYNLAWSELE